MAISANDCQAQSQPTLFQQCQIPNWLWHPLVGIVADSHAGHFTNAPILWLSQVPLQAIELALMHAGACLSRDTPCASRYLSRQGLPLPFLFCCLPLEALGPQSLQLALLLPAFCRYQPPCHANTLRISSSPGHPIHSAAASASQAHACVHSGQQ